MRTLFIFSLFFVMVVSSSGQVINYEVDSDFSVGNMYQKAAISSIATFNGSFIISGSTFNQTSPEGAITQISFNGAYIHTISDETTGPPNVVEYKDNLLQYGSRIDRFNLFGIGLGFEFEYSRPPYSGFISDQESIAFVTPEENILVGGIFFTDSTDISTNSLRQLCMIDSTGAPIPGFPMVKCEPFNARILTIDTLSTNEYIIGGSFSSLNGHPTNNVAKLHADFSVDTSFVSPLSNGGNAGIQFIDSLDRIWMVVGGSGFILSLPDIDPGMVRLLPSGVLDTTFIIPEITREIDGFELPGYSSVIVPDIDSTYIIGGVFVSYNGTEKHGLIKINDDGSLIPEAFDNLGVDEAVWGGFTSNYLGVTNIKKLLDGKLLLGGSFSSFGGEPYNCLIRLKPDGFVGIDETKPLEKLKVFPNPANNTIHVNLPEENQYLEHLRFFDLSGRMVLVVDHPMAGKAIGISGLSSGMYLLEGRTEKGVFSGKVVVE